MQIQGARHAAAQHLQLKTSIGTGQIIIMSPKPCLQSSRCQRFALLSEQSQLHSAKSQNFTFVIINKLDVNSKTSCVNPGHQQMNNVCTVCTINA